MATQSIKYKNYFSTNQETDLTSYIKNIKNIPLLSDEEQMRLFIQYKNGDKQAKTKLIYHNLRLVVHIAKRYYYDDFSFEDIIQEGNYALMKAVEGFNINTEFKFYMYAAKVIENRIKRYIANTSSVIRVPDYLHKYIKIYDQIKLNNPNISDKKIIEIMDISEYMLDNIKRAKRNILSLDLSVDEDKDITLNNIVAYDELFTEDMVFKNIVLEDMFLIMDNCLTENEKIVIMHRYCYDNCDYLTQEQLGKILGLTRQRIDQIEKKAIGKLKEAFVVKEKQIYFDDKEMRFKTKTIINNLF